MHPNLNLCQDSSIFPTLSNLFLIHPTYFLIGPYHSLDVSHHKFGHQIDPTFGTKGSTFCSIPTSICSTQRLQKVVVQLGSPPNALVFFASELEVVFLTIYRVKQL